MTASVVPKEAPGTSKPSVALVIVYLTVIPNLTLAAQWQLQDEDGKVNEYGTTELTTEQYNEWGAGSDVEYLADCFASNLGLTLS